jgi:hypothetical protein
MRVKMGLSPMFTGLDAIKKAKKRGKNAETGRGYGRKK